MLGGNNAKAGLNLKTPLRVLIDKRKLIGGSAHSQGVENDIFAGVFEYLGFGLFANDTEINTGHNLPLFSLMIFDC